MRWSILGLVTSLLLLCSAAKAADIYDCYNGSTEQGGNRLTVNGIQSLQYAQQSFPNATVEVYIHNTTTHPPGGLWQDAAGTIALANPFTSTSHGVVFACIADGRYDFKYSGTTITTPFTVSDIKFCFACSGGGGGTVGPGTINQVSKFTTTSNVGDSSGGPDDGTNPVPWINGLSVNDSGYNKRRPNGANCTVQNLLVQYDGSVVGGLASVQTAVVNAQHVIGVAGQGASCSGNVQIVDHAFHTCIFDNQTVIGDAVIASPTTAGYCSDGGGSVQGTQVVGRVASLNTGTGTLAVVDWFTGDTSQAAGTITSCATAGSNAYYPGIGSVVACDPLVTDDGAGVMTMRGAGFTDSTHAGYWYQTQGVLITQAAMLANSFYFSPGASVATSYGLQPFATAPTAGNCVDLVAGDATGWLRLHDAGAPCGSGTVTVPQMNTPVAPTLAVGGTPGAATVTYLVQGCQDGTTCAYHTLTSSTSTVTTANATLSSSPITLTVYGNTLYGPRCYNIYRTVGGPSQGKIGTCTDKAFIDTGLAGDGTTATNTNTTVLDPNGLTAPLPGCNKIPAAPWGIDGPPCTPNAMDAEFTAGDGSFTLGDANHPFWTRRNWGGSTTATLSNGELIINDPSASGVNWRLLTQPTPSTPWTFVTTFQQQGQAATSNPISGMCLYDGTKVMALAFQAFNLFGVYKDSTVTGGVSTAAVHTAGASNGSSWFYGKISDDGSTLKFFYSGDGIDYVQIFSESVGTFITPTQIGPCHDAEAGTLNATSFDYFRRTQ